MENRVIMFAAAFVAVMVIISNVTGKPMVAQPASQHFRDGKIFQNLSPFGLITK